MDERLEELFHQGISLLGSESEMGFDDVKILRAFLAEGFYKFSTENKHRKSKKDDYAWMLAQANKMGVNA